MGKGPLKPTATETLTMLIESGGVDWTLRLEVRTINRAPRDYREEVDHARDGRKKVWGGGETLTEDVERHVIKKL